MIEELLAEATAKMDQAVEHVAGGIVGGVLGRWPDLAGLGRVGLGGHIAAFSLTRGALLLAGGIDDRTLIPVDP